MWTLSSFQRSSMTRLNSELTNFFTTQSNLWNVHSLIQRNIRQPKTPALTTVDKLFRPEDFANPVRVLRVFGDECTPFFMGDVEMATIGWFIAENHLIDRPQWFCTWCDCLVWTGYKIGADVWFFTDCRESHS